MSQEGGLLLKDYVKMIDLDGNMNAVADALREGIQSTADAVYPDTKNAPANVSDEMSSIPMAHFKAAENMRKLAPDMYAKFLQYFPMVEEAKASKKVLDRQLFA
jgi:hypothetical protein